MLTEPTLANLHTAIDGHLVRGVGNRHLVGATRYGSRLLLDSREDPLPVSEMIVLYDNTQIRIWCRQCPPSEPMEVLFRRHHHSESEPGTPAPFAYAYGGRIIGMSPTPILSPARSRRISWSLKVLMTAMVASQNPLPQRQSGGRPRSSKLPVCSELRVQPILPVQRRLVPGPRNGCEIASQNPLPQRQSGGRPGCPKLPVRSDPTVRPKLPVRQRLVLGPRDGREIEVG